MSEAKQWPVRWDLLLRYRLIEGEPRLYPQVIEIPAPSES